MVGVAPTFWSRLVLSRQEKVESFFSFPNFCLFINLLSLNIKIIFQICQGTSVEAILLIFRFQTTEFCNCCFFQMCRVTVNKKYRSVIASFVIFSYFPNNFAKYITLNVFLMILFSAMCVFFFETLIWTKGTLFRFNS